VQVCRYRAPSAQPRWISAPTAYVLPIVAVAPRISIRKLSWFSVDAAAGAFVFLNCQNFSPKNERVIPRSTRTCTLYKIYHYIPYVRACVLLIICAYCTLDCACISHALTQASTAIDNNNNNNNSHDDVYGAVAMTKVIAKVHPVHLMNVD